jgi:hypothetical protein
MWGRRVMLRRFWGGNMKERDHLDDLAIEGSVILKWILKKLVYRLWTGCMWPICTRVAGCCADCNEPSGSIKCGELLD